KVDGIRVLQIRLRTEVRLAGVHRDQAATDVGARPRILFIRVPVTRTIWRRSRLNRLILNGLWILAWDTGALVFALGHLPAVTLAAPAGLALPGITPAHPPRLFDDSNATVSVLSLHEPRGAHLAGAIYRGGPVLPDSPSVPVLADVLVIADEDHGADASLSAPTLGVSPLQSPPG